MYSHGRFNWAWLSAFESPTLTDNAYKNIRQSLWKNDDNITFENISTLAHWYSRDQNKFRKLQGIIENRHRFKYLAEKYDLSEYKCRTCREFNDLDRFYLTGNLRIPNDVDFIYIKLGPMENQIGVHYNIQRLPGFVIRPNPVGRTVEIRTGLYSVIRFRGNDRYMIKGILFHNVR